MPKSKNIKDVIEKLHPLERKVIAALKKSKNFKEIINNSNLKPVEVMRGLQWLENKDAVKIQKSKDKIVLLDKNGIKYLKNGLPEKKFLLIVKKKPCTIIDVKKKLGKEETNASIGILRKKNAIVFDNEKIKITKEGNVLLTKKSPVEEFFKKVSKGIPASKLNDNEKKILKNLLKRKEIVKLKDAVKINIKVTDFGKELMKQKIDLNVVTSLTPNMIKTGSWKKKKLRAFDVKINVPEINGGKKYFANQAVDYMKNLWLSMGFKEMEGTFCQTAFWDLGSLFVPQDHPAREMQDTFYLADLKNSKKILKGKIDDKKLMKRVKDVHENGGDTGSKGWGGEWSEDKAKEVLLRTHTTVLSAQTISKLKKEDLPAKFFSIKKVFRNEALDWKHLFEFYQVEGIVVDPNADFRDLVGYLKTFFMNIGYLDVRIRPAYFPYTEPSVEVEVLHPVKKEWVELGGAGIFRPEVTKTLMGFECPVLAWGLGMERIITEYYNITDLRDIYTMDVDKIKKMKWWIK